MLAKKLIDSVRGDWFAGALLAGADHSNPHDITDRAKLLLTTNLPGMRSPTTLSTSPSHATPSTTTACLSSASSSTAQEPDDYWTGDTTTPNGDRPTLREQNHNKTAIRDPSAGEACRGQNHNKTAIGGKLIGSQSRSEGVASAKEASCSHLQCYFEQATFFQRVRIMPVMSPVFSSFLLCTLLLFLHIIITMSALG